MCDPRCSIFGSPAFVYCSEVILSFPIMLGGFADALGSGFNADHPGIRRHDIVRIRARAHQISMTKERPTRAFAPVAAFASEPLYRIGNRVSANSKIRRVKVARSFLWQFMFHAYRRAASRLRPIGIRVGPGDLPVAQSGRPRLLSKPPYCPV